MADELALLGARALAQRLALDVELALEQLALGLHRDVLAGGHGEGPGHQAGQPGQPDDRARRVGTGDAQDQRDVGDQPVADPEHGGPGPAALHVPVVVLGCSRGRSGAPLPASVATRVGAAVQAGRIVEMAQRKWIDKTQPQTLQAAVLFSYLNAAFGLFYLRRPGRRASR